MVEMRNQKELKVDHEINWFDDPTIDVRRAKDAGAAGSRAAAAIRVRLPLRQRELFWVGTVELQRLQ